MQEKTVEILGDSEKHSQTVGGHRAKLLMCGGYRNGQEKYGGTQIDSLNIGKYRVRGYSQSLGGYSNK